MRILVLGGTAWLGREVARAWQRDGAEVTCLARGESGDAPAGVRWSPADRSRPDAYDAVRSQDWDEVVEVSWQPSFVRGALDALAARAAHWTYVSSGSVYADHSVRGADESAPLLPALSGESAGPEQYGEAKVACEGACRAVVADRLLVARAGLIAGYGDRSDRFGYWPARFARETAHGAAGPVLVPDAPDATAQAIDVHDLADWLVRAGMRGTTGVFDAVGEVWPLTRVLREAAETAGYAGEQVAVPSGWLREQGVEEFMGPRSLPLWLADPDWAGFSARSGARARAAGLATRPLETMVEDALRWERELGLARARRAGLTPDEETALLRDWAARS